MKTFPEQLLAARKASGLTQEQLAEQMNVSRPMISHWETGRSLPDFESVKRLSKLLQFNFMQEDAPKPFAEGEVFSANEGNESHQKHKRKYLYAFLGGVAITVVAISLVFISLPERSRENPDPVIAAAQAETPSPSILSVNPMEWYQQPNEHVDGQAYLALSVQENPLRALPASRHVSGIVGWELVLDIREENGIDFAVTEYSVAFFFEGLKEYIYRYEADVLKTWWGSNTIPAYGTVQNPSSFPMDERKRIGVGLMVKGIDANGNEREFHYFVELSQEIAE